ncbi:DUF2314 domain-containing protein [Chitinophaga lutea]
MKKMLFPLLLTAVSFTSCVSGSNDRYSFNDDDSVMNAAMARARTEWPEFCRQLKEHPDSADYSVCLRFPNDFQVEHMWVSRLRWEDTILYGTVEQARDIQQGFTSGDEVRVEADYVTDWLIIANGKAKGGYKLREILRRLNEEKRAEWEKDMDYTFE